jgi:hypothetical protein
MSKVTKALEEASFKASHATAEENRIYLYQIYLLIHAVSSLRLLTLLYL